MSTEPEGRAGTSVSLAQTQERLVPWLQRRWAGARVDRVTSPSSNGFSNETIFVDWHDGGASRSSVLRVAPQRPSIFPDSDVRLQHDLLEVVGGLGLTVPRAEGFEADVSWIGAPFFLMERAPGRVPGDDPPYTRAGWVFDLPASTRADLHRHAARALLAVADVPIVPLREQLATRGHRLREGLAAEIDYYDRYLTWASAGAPLPELVDTLAWLRENQPADRHQLVWGDARIGNIVFGPSSEVTAILDWDMVAIAPAELDLGWWLFHQRYFTEGIGVDLPDGLLTAEAMVREWESRRGTVEDLTYWEVFGGFRLALFVLRGMALLVEAGTLPPDKAFGPRHRVMRTLRALRESPSA